MPSNADVWVGMEVERVPTPALVVDLDVLDRNIATLAAHAASSRYPIALMPHAKTHKSVHIAQRQIAMGAQGVCCQTLREVESMAAGGVTEIMHTNQIVDAQKADRLARVARSTRLFVCVDDQLQIDLLERAAQHHGSLIEILVEIDVGSGRCGVQPGIDAVRLAVAVAESKHLRFAGLQAYHGPAQHFRSSAGREEAIRSVVEHVELTRAALRAAGLACDVVAGAGTGTYMHEQASGVFTHLQCGSYVFMDADYSRNASEAPFEHSLFVLSSVISHAGSTRAICDAGLKAVSTDSGLPIVHADPDVAYVKANDEHGTLSIRARSGSRLGTRIWLIPGHCDPTVNLYDQLVAYRSGRVEEIWPVTRGY